MRVVTIGDLSVPVSFTPPLKVSRMETVKLVAPSIEAYYGLPVRVELDGMEVEWRNISAKSAGNSR
jgi:hypothetical protein